MDMNLNSNNGETKPKNKKLIIAIVAIAVFLSCSCCCCGSALLFGSSDNKDESESSSVSTSESESSEPEESQTEESTEEPTEDATDTPDDKLKDLSIGDSVTIDGVTVSVDSIEPSESSFGTPTFEVHITYKNDSGKSLSITPYDWQTVLHTGSDNAHVGGDASFHLETIKDGEEWSGIVSLWDEDKPEKIKFESSSLSKSATWMLPVKEEPTTEKTEEPTAAPKTEPTKETVEHRSGENIVGISNRTFSSYAIRINFQDHVQNDTTGNWKLAKIPDTLEIEKFALDYFNNYFRSGNEVHAIVNSADNTTTRITVSSDSLNVTIFEHIENEEYDANELFGGEIIADYKVYTDNGDIEKLS